MFINSSDDSSLVFIRSNNINVFPCSRRRSTLVDSDSGSVLDKYYIPFDPEARLNTEANNRKHSGLNGFKQSYIYDWNEVTGKLSIVLAGYLFDIQLDDNSKTPALLGAQMETLFNNNPQNIFAKIRIGDTPFFSGGAGVPEARTKVLAHLTATGAIPNSLDTLLGGTDDQEIDNYYFTGLALTYMRKESASENIIYLPLIEKVNGKWQVYEHSKLPNIDHGSIADSVKVGTLEANSVKIAGSTVASMKVVETDKDVFQLQFTTVG